MLDRLQAAALEALSDERLAGLDPAELDAAAVASLADLGLPGDDPARVAELLEPWRAGRKIAWASRRVTQGEVLAAFADHCANDLDDVEVLERDDARLVATWRREISRIELRAGFAGLERLASDVPTMLLGDIEADGEQLARRFVEEDELRSRIALCDLGRLERIGAVRSSVFVYLEWFLRDEFGVKLLPADLFTQGLIAKGVISLGMG